MRRGVIASLAASGLYRVDRLNASINWDTTDSFWVDDVAIDGTVISDGSSLEGWQSATTQYNPIDVEGYTLQLVAYDGAQTAARVFSVPIDGSFHGSLSGSALADAIGTSADVVSAIVTYHDDTELVTQYAPYTLTVNGVTQPGG
jgi:hypothetical protein